MGDKSPRNNAKAKKQKKDKQQSAIASRETPAEVKPPAPRR